MTADERLALIRVKVERAKQHINDLEVARDRFIETNPYAVESKRNPQTGYDNFYVTNIQSPPAEIGIIAGDVIHNLRSALDHLAYQLVLVNSGAPTKQTAFPIWEDAAEYKAQRHRRVKSMAQAAVDAIDAAEPYKGGKGVALWILHELDIADKHHALLVALLCVGQFTTEIPGSFISGRFTGLTLFSLPNFGKPLEDGDVIFTCEPDTHKDAKFTFDVALTEPEIIKGKPLVPLLVQLANHVDNLILSFKPLLS